MIEQPLGSSATFDGIELFNTMLGLLNFASNSSQHDNQVGMEEKLDLILAKLSDLERRLPNVEDDNICNL